MWTRKCNNYLSNSEHIAKSYSYYDSMSTWYGSTPMLLGRRHIPKETTLCSHCPTIKTDHIFIVTTHINLCGEVKHCVLQGTLTLPQLYTINLDTLCMLPNRLIYQLMGQLRYKGTVFRFSESTTGRKNSRLKLTIMLQ